MLLKKGSIKTETRHYRIPLTNCQQLKDCRWKTNYVICFAHFLVLTHICIHERSFEVSCSISMWQHSLLLVNLLSTSSSAEKKTSILYLNNRTRTWLTLFTSAMKTQWSGWIVTGHNGRITSTYLQKKERENEKCYINKNEMKNTGLLLNILIRISISLAASSSSSKDNHIAVRNDEFSVVPWT